MYEMLAGKRPFREQYHEALVYEITNLKQPSLFGLRKEVPVFLEKVVDRCLEKLPSARFPDAQTLIEQLRAADKEIRLARSDVEELLPGKVSVMPAGLDKQLSLQELADLVEFLRNCK